MSTSYLALCSPVPMNYHALPAFQTKLSALSSPEVADLMLFPVGHQLRLGVSITDPALARLALLASFRPTENTVPDSLLPGMVIDSISAHSELRVLEQRLRDIAQLVRGRS